MVIKCSHWGQRFSIILLGAIAAIMRPAAHGFVLNIRRCRQPFRQIAALSDSQQDAIDNMLTYVDSLLSGDHDGRGRIKKTTSERSTNILARIDSLHAADVEVARQSALVMEPPLADSNPKTHHDVPFEWIDVSRVAIQSLESILNKDTIHKIQAAAHALMETKSTTSRFTYQFKTNAEAHLADLEDPLAIQAINEALVSRIYPLIRTAFLDDANDHDNRLFVYDALFIRYNATSTAPTAPAGQPFHRDLGLVSVNIMLNDDFDGGGTYFENQRSVNALKPAGGMGYCLAHRSNERHAGAATKSGIRDILVFFISAQRPTGTVRNAHLKQCRDYCIAEYNGDALATLLCRIQHQRMAIECLPTDGEAYQYLGTALMELAGLYSGQHQCAQGQAPSRNASTDNAKSLDALQAVVLCLQHASELTPCDARVYNNLGLALGRLLTLTLETTANDDEVSAYARGLQLLLQQAQSGCNVQSDLVSLSLNYGLHLANQDRFAKAAQILRHAATANISPRTRTMDDAQRLLQFCLQQC